MKFDTLEEEKNYIRTKEKAQKLIVELYCYINVTQVFCQHICDCPDSDTTKCMLKHILKLAGKLYVELDASSVSP